MNRSKLEAVGLTDEQVDKVEKILADHINGNYAPLDKLVSRERELKAANSELEKFKDVDIHDLQKKAKKVDELETEIKSANERVKELNSELENSTLRIKKEFKWKDYLADKVLDTALEDAAEKFDLSALVYDEEKGEFTNAEEIFTPFSERYTYMLKPQTGFRRDKEGNAGGFKPVAPKPNPEANNPPAGNTEKNRSLSSDEVTAYAKERQRIAKEKFGLK